MRTDNLVRVIVGNAMRNRKHFALSAFGIVIGITAFVFFLALSMGVRHVVLGEIFPLERLEVVPPSVSLGGPKSIDDEIVAAVRARPEVVEVVPRMRMNFPALGRGYFQGQRFPFEAGGFGDGVDPSFVKDESFAELFQDWEADERRKSEPCGPPPRFTCEDSQRYYCDRTTLECHHRVPIIISDKLLEIYNKQFAGSHGMPQIGTDLAKFIVAQGGYGKVKAEFFLGDSVFAAGARRTDEPVRRVEGMLLGISDRAIDLGFTVPIQYVRRWNAKYAGEKAAATYSSLVVTVRDSDDVATFGNFVQRELDLRLADSMAERFSLLILIVTALFLLIALIIVSISAVNIAHNLFMQVMERQREIGLMRAVGATRRDVARIILGEAALVGFFAGVMGTALARAAGLGIDFISANYVADFMFKPTTYFDFQWWIVGSGIGFAVLFCIVGGLLPARRAAKMAPARALVQN